MSDALFGNSYQTEFDPVSYLKTFYANVQGSEEEGDILKLKLSFLHQLASDLPSNKEMLLDLGCGPCIDSVISLSSKCSRIFMAEFMTSSRRQIEKWVLAQSDAHDWSPFFRFAAEKEHIENWREIETRVRQKIQLPILMFNALEGDVIGREQGGNDGLPTGFDIVVTSLCLEAATTTLDEYESALKRVANMIKADGYFIMFGVLGETYYAFDDKRFFCQKLDEGQIQKALDKSGFRVEKWLSNKEARGSELSEAELAVADFSGIFAVRCRKK